MTNKRVLLIFSSVSIYIYALSPLHTLFLQTPTHPPHTDLLKIINEAMAANNEQSPKLFKKMHFFYMDKVDITILYK